MHIITSLGFVFLSIAVMVNFVLAVTVYRNNSKSATNLVYTILSIVMSIWLVVNYFSLQPVFLRDSLLLIRLSLFFATLLNALFLLLAKTIPKQRVNLGVLGASLLIVSTATVMILTISPLVFSSVQIVGNSPTPVPGPGIAIFGAFSIMLNVLAIHALIRRYRDSFGEEKQQIRLVMFGVLIMFGAIILTVFMPVVIFKSSLFVPLLPFYVLIFLTMTGYSIVNYHLFDIRVVATEALALSIWIILGSKIFAGTDVLGRVLEGLVEGF